MVAPPRKGAHLEAEVRGADDIPRPCSESPVNGKRIMGFLENSPRIISPRQRLTEQPPSNRNVCGYEHNKIIYLTRRRSARYILSVTGRGKMKLYEAYAQAVLEDWDPKERTELSDSTEIKTLIVEEIMEAMKEIRDHKGKKRTTVDLINPIFKCVAFWFIIGIRVGKILRDEELATK
jgi:hypothetical protein